MKKRSIDDDNILSDVSLEDLLYFIKNRPKKSEYKDALGFVLDSYTKNPKRRYLDKITEFDSTHPDKAQRKKFLNVHSFIMEIQEKLNVIDGEISFDELDKIWNEAIQSKKQRH